MEKVDLIILFESSPFVEIGNSSFAEDTSSAHRQRYPAKRAEFYPRCGEEVRDFYWNRSSKESEDGLMRTR
jgi:hypothetical protein